MNIVVDALNGKDDILNFSESYQTLDKAIEMSNSGDYIELKPGNYNGVKIESKIRPFELIIKGSGIQTICNTFIFDGLFDITFEKIKLENINLITKLSNFTFCRCKFTARNEMLLEKFLSELDNNTSNNEDNKTFIVFENCIFDYNFQIKITSGSYIVEIKNCQIRKSTIPLIFAKKGELVLKLSAINMENTILKNTKALVEIQYTCCIFTCPLYSGSDCLVISKDNTYSMSPIVYPTQFIHSSSEIKSDNLLNEENYNSTNLDERDTFRAISLDTDIFPNTLKIHKYTRILRLKGSNPIDILLPNTLNLQNGYSLLIFSEIPYIKIDNKKYTAKKLTIYWILNEGWFFVIN